MNKAQFERELYCLKSAGYMVVPGFISKAQTNAVYNIVQAFEEEVEQYFQAGGNVEFRHGWPLRTTRCLYCVSEEVQDLAMNEIIQQFAQSYLDGAVLRDCVLQTNMPDPRNKKRGIKGGLSFHRDTLWLEDKIAPAYLHAFVLMTDFTKTNGATFVVPGTHLSREPGYYFKHTDPKTRAEGSDYQVYEQKYFPSAIQITAPKGSLILLDPIMIHTQGINVTESRRSLINFTFRNRNISGNPPLLNARKIAESYSRVPVRKDFLDILESNPSLPSYFGPLGGNVGSSEKTTRKPWEKIIERHSS